MEKQLELDFTSKLGEGITTTDSIIRREMYEMQKHIHGLQDACQRTCRRKL